MSTFENKSFFDDQLLTSPRPLDNMSSAERMEYERTASLNPRVDPEISSLIDTFGAQTSGMMSSFIGKTGARLGMFIDQMTSDDEAYFTPLNFESKPEAPPIDFAEVGKNLGPIGKWHLPSEKNNIESITEDLMGIDPATHGWILSSSSYGEYLDRLDFARISSEEFAAQAGGLGKTAGFVADTAAIVAMSLIAEPLAFAGYGQRFIQSGQRISNLRSTERFGAMYSFAEEAAEASQMVGRLSGMSRYAMLVLGEELAIKIAREGIDPTFDPEAKSIVFDAAIAMGIGGAIGGFAARSFAASQIQKYAENFYHQARLGSGMIVNFHTPLAFVSSAAADGTLLGQNIMPVGETIDNIADEAWTVFSTTGREFQPGTQSLSLPVLQADGTMNRVEDVGAALLSGAVRPSAFGSSMYTPANGPLLDALLTEGRSGGWRGPRAGGTGMPKARGAFARTLRRISGMPENAVPNGIVFTNRRGNRQLAAGIGEDVDIERNLYEGGSGRGTGIEIELDSTTLRGDFIPSGSLFAAAEEGDVAFRYSGNWRNLNNSVRSVAVSPAADPAEANRLGRTFESRGWNVKTLQDGTKVYTPSNRPRFTATNAQWGASVTGVQSTVLNIVAEIQRRGGTVDQNLARAVARSLFAAHTDNLKGIAFEEKVWETVSKFVDPQVMQKIREARRLGNSPPIRGIDQAFDDLVERQRTMDGLWSGFNVGLDEAGDVLPGMGLSAPLENPSQASLILQVANEVRRRGGNVTREVFEEIVEDLRSLMQNPPMRTNSKGKQVLDSRMRLARVAEIINRRVPEGTGRIAIPRSLEGAVKAFGSRLEASRKVVSAGEKERAEAAGGVAGGAPAKVSETSVENSADGALRMQAEIPQLDRYDTLGPIARFFNQAAVLIKFDNPAARMAAFIAFNARRAMRTRGGVDVAQGQTVFEATTYEMTGYLSRGLTGYRNGYVRFALGKGAGDKITLMDSLKAGFGKGSRQKVDEFNRAVIEQLRTGKFNHANDGVNETARQLREMFNKLHETASQAGLKGFQKGANLNYVPRLWRWDRVARLGTTPEGRKALEQMLEKSLGGSTGTRQVMMDDGTLENLPDVAAAAKVLADRLINLANNSDLAPVLDIEDEIAKAINGLLGPVSPSGAARTPFGRPRIILDETAEIFTAADNLNSGKNSLSLADLTMDDLPAIMRKYTVSVFGAIGEKRFIERFNEQLAHFGIKSASGAPVQVETIQEMISMINKIGNINGTLGGSMTPTELDALREIVSAIRYEPLHRANRDLGSLGRIGDKVAGVMLPLGYLSTGGAFGFVAASETSRIIGTLGLKTTLRQMPLLGEMVSNWRNMDEGAKNMASMLDHAFHPATDRLRRVLMMQIQNQYGGEQTLVERGLNRLSNFFSDVTLLAPVTSFTQHLMAASTIQHFYDVAKGAAGRMDDATIRTLGLEPRQYDELVDFVGTNAITKQRGSSQRVVDLNNIHDIRMDNLRAFVDRAVRTRIQDMPTRGDFHKIGFSFLGRLMTQFRGFNLKGVDNFMLQNLSRVRRGDNASKLRVGQEIMFTMIFSALIQYSRHYMDAQSYRAAGNDKKADEIENNQLGAQGFIRGGLTGPSEFFLPLFAVDTAWTQLISDDPLFSAYRYSGLGMYGFPAATFVSKSYDISKDVLGATVAKTLGIEDKEREITERTVHKFRLLLPFQNFVPVKHLFNIAEEEIAEEYNLLERQPRRSRKVEG